MKKNQLVEMIRSVVREELRAQLPKVVSEMFIRGLVNEQLSSGGRLREEENFEDADDIPTPLNNDDEGIYQEDDMIKSEGRRILNKLLSNDNPMKSLYEGVETTKNREREAVKKSSIDLSGLDFNKMNRVLEKTSKTGAMRQSPEAEQRRLDALRANLDGKK